MHPTPLMKEQSIVPVHDKSLNYLLIGVLMGLSFPVISFTIDFVHKEIPVGFAGMVTLLKANPIHWIILSAPIVLGGIFFYMGKSTALREKLLQQQSNHSKKQLTLLENFIADLERNDLNATVSEEFDNVEVTNFLNQFRNKLSREKEAEEKRAWEIQGLARAGELLRIHNDLTKLSDEILRFLVHYLKCTQGSTFILQEREGAEPVLELKACYAYERKKFLTKTIDVGQGLAGQCFLEKETMLLYKVPQDYITITSGLGQANPTSLVLVPIKTNDEVCGIFELASFNKLTEHEVRFLEKAADAFASVIISLRGNEKTKVLLEASQQQAEMLRSQEEEMRQNMEEMQALQEQMTRQLEENNRIKEAIEIRERILGMTTILSETDLRGVITFVNDKFCEIAKYHPNELIGQPHNIVRHPDMPKDLFRLFWSTIKKGEVFRGIVKNRAKDGTHYWVDATIVPILDKDNNIVKYVGARYHLRDEDLALMLYNKQATAMGWPLLSS